MGFFETFGGNRSQSAHDKDVTAHEILNDVTQRERALTDDDKRKLEDAGLGDLVGDIETHQKDPSIPPWMH